MALPMAGATSVEPGSPSPTGSLSAVDELDVELRYVPDAKRRVAGEIRILHLAFDERGALIERHAEPPERSAFDLRQRAIRINDAYPRRQRS